MIKTDKGYIEFEGTVGELVADYTVVTKSLLAEVLEDFDEKTRFAILLTAVTTAISGSDGNEEEHEEDDLAELVREAMRREFDEPEES